MAEFTGERVIPGEVDPNLWNEHFARYAYAAQFAAGCRVADLGCGTGYGTAELSRTSTLVVGVDISREAIAYARQQYPDSCFLVGSVEQVPLASAKFDLLTAFEVVEHLEHWPQLLAEARRLLTAQGLFLVSTPNKSYYAESRREQGPNPFHVHEFEYEEFTTALQAVFPYTSILLENHAEGVAITNPSLVNSWTVHSSPSEQSDLANRTHFYLAVCSASPLPELPSFVYLPTTANLLQQREHHIDKLAGEIQKKDAWMAEYRAERAKFLAEHQEMIDLFQRQQSDMEQQARWTQQVNADLAAAQARIAQLQDEMAADQQAALAMARGYEAKITNLEEESQRVSAWAESLKAEFSQYQDLLQSKTVELEAKCQELALCVEYLHRAEADLEERTTWAHSLQTESQRLTDELERAQALVNFARSSRWVKVGRRLGVGPAL